MDKEGIAQKAISFFSDKGYSLKIRTDDMLVFQSDEREYSLVILIILFILGIAPAIVYYMLAPKHEVTISLSGEEDAIKVTTWGNTDEAKEDVDEFKKVISETVHMPSL